ncbi:protein of unknown function [Pseudodesulfovibrio piezophilus C1TLV30]|uniref:Uncharacterized protein n=1 Tax=Pseudodesulfovibrio piezophilus (strain DSM 21447 / JCM 15486 / C1TLV30) TaxID=1322246 RepID=M1WUR5_PSEP2|nr:protein of unknown function [Pseudodesulfovibrio piezophilus C1TLV30]
MVADCRECGGCVEEGINPSQAGRQVGKGGIAVVYVLYIPSHFVVEFIWGK